MKYEKRFILRDSGVVKNATAYLASLNTHSGVLLEMVVRPHKSDRSAAQNRLYWDWVTAIANEIGHSKLEQHEILKIHYLLPILERDDPDVFDLVQRLGHDKDRLAKYLSTTDLSTKQFSEYLNDVDHFAAQVGIRLRHPDDDWYEELGGKL